VEINVAHHDVLDQDRIAQLIAGSRVGEDPALSLYLRSWGSAGDRSATLKNLVKEAEAAIEGDTGWDDERKKEARALLEDLHRDAAELLSGAPTQGRGSWAMFYGHGKQELLTLPLDVPERVVIDRTFYASPLSSLIDQYERYQVLMCDQKKAKLFECYLGQIEAWEEIEHDHERHRGAPAGGPARGGGGGGVFQGLEELRRRNHAEYVLHQHLASVADRAFRRHKLRPTARVILAGPRELLPKLEEHLHSYLRERIVAREQLPLSLTKKQARERVMEIEARVEEEKERALLAKVQNRMGTTGLSSTGMDSTLSSLFYGKVHTLIVMDGEVIPGRECPESGYLFVRREDLDEKTPTFVASPITGRDTRRVPDVVDEAVEMAILSGCRVEHIAYAKDELGKLGGMAALLRFK
jgi:peptide chain release factor subunit 1